MRLKPVSAHFADPSTVQLGLKRRAVLARSAAVLLLPLFGLGGPAMAQTERRASKVELLATWRKSGGVLLIRHAATESGIGDPPGFVIGQCRTQRNLSEAGRQASRALGAWLQAQNFKPDAVRSSQWCRCQDTARLAFGAYEDWPALNSTFAGQGNPAAQQQALRERLQALPAGRTEVWVTHQVIMTGLTGAYPGLGEGFVVDRQGRLLARGDLAA
jgi:phosphohistidine phosphatase SixA